MRGPDAYPTVSGVAASARVLIRRHPDLCRMRPAGESRAGRPLWLLSVGHGARHILVVAGAHPDQQAGGGTALWLAEQAVHTRRQLADADLTWDFLLCLDPDGTLLNETGPAGPRPAAVHYRHAYHPAAAERPESAGAFRQPGDQLPETRALLAVIDELRPFLQCSLHGTDVGGSRVRLTADVPGLAEPFGKYAAELDIPVRTGMCEASSWQGAGPGVFVLPSGAERESARCPVEGPDEGSVRGPVEGPDEGPAWRPDEGSVLGSTWGRPHRHGGLTALIEVPMWASRLVADPAPHPEPAKAVAALAARLRKDGTTAAGTLERARAYLPRAQGPLLRGVEHATGALQRLADDYETLAAASPVSLTTAQVAALDITARRVPLLAAGMLLRLLDEQRHVDDDPTGEPGRLHSRLERRLDAGARDLITGADARWVPVGAQIELQARTTLAAARLLN